MSQKGLTPVVIVLLIAAAIGGYLVYSGKINLPQKQIDQPVAEIYEDEVTKESESDSSENWETYMQDGVYLEYPNDWSTGKSGGGPVFTSPGPEEGSLGINTNGPGNSDNAEELLDKIVAKEDILKKEDVIINGITGIKIVNRNRRTAIFIDNGKIKNKDLITVIIGYGDNTGEMIYKDEEIFNKILSTFKFTN